MHILLNVGRENWERPNTLVDIHYLDPGGKKFSFVTQMSIRPLSGPANDFNPTEFAFSADGSKFALGMGCGGVYVWNIQSKVPLRTITEAPRPKDEKPERPRFLQFSSGNLGKEILVSAEVCLMFTF